MWVLGLNPGPLEEPVLLTAEPPLQPLSLSFKVHFHLGFIRPLLLEVFLQASFPQNTEAGGFS